MDVSVNSGNSKFKQRGRLISAIVHVIFLVLLLIPFLNYPDPPPGQEGITVNLGVPEFDEIEEPAPSAPNTEPEPEPVEEEQQQEEKVTPEPPKPEKEPVKEPEVIEAEDPEQIALKKKQEQERQERLRQEREEQARLEAEAEARRKAEEERKRKEAEAAENKEKFSDLFKNSSGEGTGDKQSGGDPGGDPNTGALESISTGSGKVGGDLTGRGRPTNSPTVTDNSQKEGTVVIKVCVDEAGNVISARYTQGGSTTGDATLKRLAESNAKKWKFPSGSKVDCGTITYTFKVK
jgi:outer membrane biosynthesis protein TonB